MIVIDMTPYTSMILYGLENQNIGCPSKSTVTPTMAATPDNNIQHANDRTKACSKVLSVDTS